jgi:hypothetical protein
MVETIFEHDYACWDTEAEFEKFLKKNLLTGFCLKYYIQLIRDYKNIKDKQTRRKIVTTIDNFIKNCTTITTIFNFETLNYNKKL